MLETKNRRIENLDMVQISLMLILIAFGLFNIYSATYSASDNQVSKIFYSQLTWVGIGILFTIAAIVIDYRFLEKVAWIFYIIVCLMLIYILVAGKSIYGAKRWLDLGFMRFQPSEVMKLVMILILAKYFSKTSKTGDYFLKDILVPLSFVFFPTILILREPDLGTAMILFLTSFSLIFFVGLNLGTLFKFLGSALVSIPVLWFFGLREYQKDRIRVFFDPGKDPLGDAWHITQSIVAVGSGMFLGKGFMSGTQNRLEFVPKQHTDFIFSVVAEEWGFAGCVVVIVLFLALVIRGLSASLKIKDRFAALLMAGVSFLIFWHTFINMGMELDILPVVGIPLPFMSYGGTSLITNMVAVGLMINVQMRKSSF